MKIVNIPKNRDILYIHNTPKSVKIYGKYNYNIPFNYLCIAFTNKFVFFQKCEENNFVLLWFEHEDN